MKQKRKSGQGRKPLEEGRTLKAVTRDIYEDQLEECQKQTVSGNNQSYFLRLFIDLGIKYYLHELEKERKHNGE